MNFTKIFLSLLDRRRSKKFPLRLLGEVELVGLRPQIQMFYRDDAVRCQILPQASWGIYTTGLVRDQDCWPRCELRSSDFLFHYDMSRQQRRVKNSKSLGIVPL